MRPELHDNEIERQLARRAAGEWRPERVLTAVRRQMDEPRTERVATPRWAALAALVGLLGVLVLLAVALPRLDLAPAAPSPTPAGGVVVLSTEEFAARLAAGELDGLTVPLLVEGRIEADDRPSIECSRPSEPCPMGVLAGVDERVQVHALGVATDDPDEASVYLYSEEAWAHWRMPEPPIEGVLVSAIDELGLVNFLGTVTLAGADVVSWPAAAVADLDAAAVAIDAVVIVDGWLTQVPGAISCRPPDPGTVLDGLPDKWCGNPAWIAPEPVAIDPAGFSVPDDFVSVQHGAYFQFAEDPAADEDGLLVPRWGTYALARRLYGGGCPDASPPCWDWSIVARLSGSPSQPVSTPVPPVTSAPDTPPPEAPPGSLTCRPYVMGGTDPSPGPVYPSLHIQLSDHTHTVVDCAYFSEFATLPEGQVIQPRWNDVDELGLTWNVAHICPSSARVELRRDAERYIVTVEQGEIEDCGVGPGRQAVIIWFDGPAERQVDASMVGNDPVPPVQPPPAPPATRIECDEITAPPQAGDRRGEAVIVDHSGVVDGTCQWFRGVPSAIDDVSVTNPTASQTLLEISWPVPMVCDYMPVELEIWRTAHGLLVHIDRAAVVDETQACRAVIGRQGLALNLTEQIMASSVATVLTTEGVATSVVDMPAAEMTWTLSLVPGQTEYAAGETIEVAAILTYDGEMGTRTLVGSGSGLVVFSIGQLDGDLSMGGLMTADCRPYEITSGESLTLPYVKGAGWSADDPNAAFYEEWVRDPEFTLPAGAWRIWASANFALGECGGRMVSLDTSIVITVR